MKDSEIHRAIADELDDRQQRVRQTVDDVLSGLLEIFKAEIGDILTPGGDLLPVASRILAQSLQYSRIGLSTSSACCNAGVGAILGIRLTS